MSKNTKEMNSGRRLNTWVYVLANVSNFLKKALRRLPFWRSPDYEPFLLLCHPRSGASRVNNALNLHPRILSLGEELRYCFGLSNGEAVLRNFFRKPQSRLVQALGFKFLYEDAYTAVGIGFWKFWREKNRKVIHLQRRNLLRLVVLDEIYRQNKAQTALAADNSPAHALEAVEIYPEIVLQRMAHFDNLQQVFQKQLKAYPNVLNIWYEELEKNPEAVFLQIQQFLGVSPKSISSLLNRQDPEPTAKLLLNYEELRVILEGDRWGAFLD